MANVVGWIKSQWQQLPGAWQTVIVAFLSGVGTVIATNVVTGQMCMTLACVKGRIPAFLAAGVAAAIAHRMKPNTASSPKTGVQ